MNFGVADDSPLPTSAGPASNCGLTRAKARQPGAAHKRRRKRLAEADEGDIADDERRPKRCLVAKLATFVRSSTVTRGSVWSFDELPVPTSSAITRAAPACRRQSVKPPVDAPTSRAVLAGHVDAECLERPGELVAAARRSAASLCASSAVLDLLAGLPLDPPRETRPAPASALAVRAFDEQHVEAHLGGHGESVPRHRWRTVTNQA